MAPRDVIISCYATPARAAIRRIAQPVDAFSEPPHVIDVNGIGSDVFMGPYDTERKAREQWGGKPFAREAAMYRDRKSGSVLKKLLARRARGIDVRRIALVGFSAGGTFIHNILASAVDAAMVDAVVLLDALHIAKLYSGQFSPKSLKPWAEFAKRSASAGYDVEYGQRNQAPFMGPLFITSHTAIRQDAAKEKLVGNTTVSSDAVTDIAYAAERNALAAGRPWQFQVDPDALLSFRPPPPPVSIGPAQGVPAPEKTWDKMPMPDADFAGNFWRLDYGGVHAADHVFQAWYVQGAIWNAFLASRWNALVESPYSVAGLGGFAPCCPGPGGNLVPPGIYPTGASILAIGAAAAVGWFVGSWLQGPT